MLKKTADLVAVGTPYIAEVLKFLTIQKYSSTELLFSFKENTGNSMGSLASGLIHTQHHREMKIGERSKK